MEKKPKKTEGIPSARITSQKTDLEACLYVTNVIYVIYLKTKKLLLLSVCTEIPEGL